MIKGEFQKMTDSYHHARSIVAKLKQAGFTAYFAGGWVRDFVMGHPSEDIDIATDAPSEKIMDLFPQTVLVGLAFGVVIVVMEGHQFEVATFRKDLHYADGRHPQGIEMSNPREDALRRDFTINGMFYDPIEEEIHDFVHGQEDIHLGIIRTIGNPYERFFEDRLRMLRAFRFSSRFSFKIDPETQEAIRQTTDKLFPAVAMERVWQEFNKMAAYPRFDEAIVQMHQLTLLDVIFPELEGVHVKDLRHWVQAYAHFPKNTPTILYLMEIFHSYSLDQKIEIAKRIKASNKDTKLIEYMDALSREISLEQKTGRLDRYSWAQLLSHPDWELGIAVLAARLSEAERIEFVQKYHDRYGILEPHILRFKSGKPLISAMLLQQHGILPGKKMGLLMKEAERLVVNENWNEAAPVLAKLAKLPLWSTN